MLHMSELLQNFANVIVFILIANRIYPYINRWNKPRKNITIGLLFGIAGIMTMLLSMRNYGVTVDLKAVLAGMSGFLGGPVAGAVSLLMIGLFRFHVGGPGMIPGLTALFAVAAAGSLLYLATRNRQIPFRRMWWAPVLFGFFIVAVQLSTTLMFEPAIRMELLKEYTLPFVIVFPLTSLLFHYFMTVEWNRHNDTMFDRVTLLPTCERVHPHWDRMIRRRRPFSIVILHPDRLKSVHDMHGSQAADAVLKECAVRLLNSVPPGSIVSRHSGQNFIVSLPSFTVLQSLIWIVETKKKLSASYAVEDGPLFLTFSTGLAVYEGGNATVEELLEQAETALRHAMDSGTNQTVPYESRLTEQMRYRTSLEKDLRFALERGQLQLHYQPQYELNTGRLRGFEALIRWNHPDWGPISPDEFIPLAEQTGLIIPIGEWVIETACRMAKKLKIENTGATMAVNVSAVQLLEPDFPDAVSAILRKTGLKSDLLEIELTESTMVRSFDQAAGQLLELKQIGVRLALDDFGVGYSSLSYLRRLPFDLIKIDRSFIEDIGRSRDDRMTKSIIDWVRQLRYGVVAEGLETYDQLYWLKQWKCDIAQGYLFSRPMPEEELLRYLRQVVPLPITRLVSDPTVLPS